MHKTPVIRFPEQNNWSEVVIMQLHTNVRDEYKCQRIKASKYSSANACRFFMFGLMQKGSTMARKESKFHIPLGASMTFKSTCANLPISLTKKKYKPDCKRKVYTVMWQNNVKALNGGEGALIWKII